MSDSDAVFVGNVTKDPEMRFTPGGSAVVKFGIAVNRRYMKDGEWVDDEPSFFNCQAWNQMAENIAASVTKGMRVICKGRLSQRSWEKDDGTKQYVIELNLDSCGPDLKFATASVEKVTREKSDGTTTTSRSGPSQKKQEAAQPEADPWSEPF